MVTCLLSEYCIVFQIVTFRCAIKSDDLPDVETLKIKIIKESEAKKRKIPDGGSDALFVKQQI